MIKRRHPSEDVDELDRGDGYQKAILMKKVEMSEGARRGERIASSQQNGETPKKKAKLEKAASGSDSEVKHYQWFYYVGPVWGISLKWGFVIKMIANFYSLHTKMSS